MNKTRPATACEVVKCTVLLIVAGVILFASLTPGQGWGGDFAAYIHQGKALATGTLDQLHAFVTYRVNYSTPELILGPAYYPWGQPALLAVVITFFGESIFAMKALMVVLMLGSQIAAYLLLRGRIHENVNLAISFFFGINAYVLMFVHNVLSDVPFTFFVILTTLLATKLLFQKRDPTVANLIWVGIAMFAAYATRTHGIALVPTVAVLHFLGKTDAVQRWTPSELLHAIKRIRLVDAIPYVVFFAGAWFVSTMLSNSIESYVSSGHTQLFGGFAFMLRGIMTNVSYYAKLPNALFGTSYLVYGLLILPLLTLGVVRAGLRNFDLLVLLAFYMAVLIIYPGQQGLRFVLPTLPLILFYLFSGARWVGSWLAKLWRHPRAASRIDMAVILLVVIGLALSTVIQTVERHSGTARSQFNAGPYESTSQEAFDFIRQNLTEDASIVFWKPRVLSYLVERNSAFVFRLEDLISGNFDYVLVQLAPSAHDEWGRLIDESTSASPEFFAAVFSNEDFVLYEIRIP